MPLSSRFNIFFFNSTRENIVAGRYTFMVTRRRKREEDLYFRKKNSRDEISVYSIFDRPKIHSRDASRRPVSCQLITRSSADRSPLGEKLSRRDRFAIRSRTCRIYIRALPPQPRRGFIVYNEALQLYREIYGQCVSVVLFCRLVE